MADVTLPNSVSANGTTTPATATLTGVTATDMLICVIAALGTSPTIATPTGDSWVQVQKTQGATLSFAMYVLTNAGAGSHTPSAVLAGTVTGWICQVFEFTATGANQGLIGSNQQALAVASVQIGAWFNSIASSSVFETWIGGAAGIMNYGPGMDQGQVMVGG